MSLESEHPGSNNYCQQPVASQEDVFMPQVDNVS